MFKYFLKRLGLLIITFAIIIFLVFVVVKSLPDNYIKPIDMSDDAYQALRIREGWDLHPVQQFFLWVRNIISDGNFGFSYKRNEDVSAILFSRIPTTLRINIFPLLFSVPIGITLGIIAALKKNKATDNIISTGVMVLISVPTFVLAVLLQYLMVVVWKLLPQEFVATGPEFANDFWFGISSYFMPIFIMTLSSVAGWTRGVRAELTEQLTSEYMLLARSKGLSKSQATFRHALKNAMVPFAPSIFTEFIALMSGSIIIEQIFRIDGVGRLYLEAFNTQDYPLLMLNVVFYTIVGLFATILADFSYSIIDPRIRVGSKK